ncbi:hypothetical protein CISIN_1g034829mg [Citrus sinensis]|uniref:Uncharacterized protein n=1 Tax=Citrus sinensis TaxID=2711 RepID=A0A067ECV8_CITSI|nr:hypothetical protein CISIN_1g034829mg [Citrus sinensis]
METGCDYTNRIAEILCPPLVNDKYVCFLASEYRRVSLAKLVDGLLWISPHMENLSIKYDLYCWKYKLSFQVGCIFHLWELKT